MLCGALWVVFGGAVAAGRRPCKGWIFFGFLLFSTGVAGEPSSIGQTGLINMPDARIAPDGTFRLGASYSEPYLPIWTSVTLLPRLEVSGRYTIIRGLDSGLGKGFGDYKDKAFDAKLLLFREKGFWPSIALGAQDFTGTGEFSAQFGTVSKNFLGTDYTLGYGRDRINGLFGGMRHRSKWIKNLSIVAEYDANDYANDFRADESGADKRKGEWTYGVEYKKGWFGVQLSNQDGDFGINSYVSIPLMDREFIPKIHEPDPFTEELPKASLDEWQADTSYAARLARTLNTEDYRNIRLGFDKNILSTSLTNIRISETGRAVGRAARILLAEGPEDIKEIQITYTVKDLPAITYRFTDTHKLQRYFDGLISRRQLDNYMQIAWVDPLVKTRLPLAALELPDDDEVSELGEFKRTDEGEFLSFRSDGQDLSTFQIVPANLGIFFNDPSGTARYDLFSRASWKKQIGRGRFFETDARLTLTENVSGVTQRSNSELPHVRSDIALYLQGDRFRMTKFLVNQYLQPAERVYARLTAGYYEMMYAGTGGQVLYLPKRGNWAADLSVDWLRQRNTDGGLGFRDYDTVTALGAFHYRFRPLGLTATARVGRFLAKDKGVRFELKRRFRSGITFGAWFTLTDGDDTQPPGSPGDPYYDKGIFASIPLNSMLTKDTKARSEFSLAPWTRDVGQMVVSPGDLYTDFERSLMLDNSEKNVTSDFGQ